MLVRCTALPPAEPSNPIKSYRTRSEAALVHYSPPAKSYPFRQLTNKFSIIMTTIPTPTQLSNFFMVHSPPLAQLANQQKFQALCICYRWLRASCRAYLFPFFGMTFATIPIFRLILLVLAPFVCVRILDDFHSFA